LARRLCVPHRVLRLRRHGALALATSWARRGADARLSARAARGACAARRRLRIRCRPRGLYVAVRFNSRGCLLPPPSPRSKPTRARSPSPPPPPPLLLSPPQPRAKRTVGGRLANAALALAYNRSDVAWRGPSYAKLLGASVSADSVITANISLSDVPTRLVLLGTQRQGATPFCQAPPSGSGGIVAPDPAQCAWFTLWGSQGDAYNASVALSDDERGLVLTATDAAPGTSVVATSFGWGTWPVNEVYSAEGLPLEPWWCNAENACVGSYGTSLGHSVVGRGQVI
jgi:hypothetical protein